MIIQVNKFGTTLVSRPSGKEAWLAFQPTLNEVPQSEEIIVDCEEVLVLTPSWADESLFPLRSRFKDKVKLQILVQQYLQLDTFLYAFIFMLSPHGYYFLLYQ